MTKEDFKIKLLEIEDYYGKSKKKLFTEFAFAHNPYKIGDIISDAKTTIKIEKIIYAKFCDLQYPHCYYTGMEIDKKGEPCENGKKKSIHQHDITK